VALFLAVGDFNGDGLADIAVASSGVYSSVAGSVSLLLATREGSFQHAKNLATLRWPTSILVGDFNGDGLPDLAVGNYATNVSILINNTPRSAR
jgi:hypothetical protein